MTDDQFQAELTRAKRVTSIGGELCKLSGAALPVIALISAVYIIPAAGIGSGALVIAIAFVLAILGAPIAALGTIATESKRQTALMAMQVWETGHL